MSDRWKHLAWLGLLVCASTALAAETPDDSRLTVKRIITQDDFHLETFGPVQWLDGGSAYSTVEPAAEGKGREIVRHETEAGTREVLVTTEALTPNGAKEPLSIDGYTWSPDQSCALIFTNTRRVWRQNTRGDYWVLNLPKKTLTRLGADGPEAALMFAKFSPDGTQVAYVRDNDIYVENLADHAVTRLTNDGSARRFNGTADWVYEEEFGLRDGFRWSPDGRRIAYWQIDDEGVDDYVLVNTTDSLYPKTTVIPYPKVGQRNPACRVGSVSASGGETRWVNLPGNSRDYYIPRMEWAGNPDEIVLQRLNRLQNTSEMTVADVATGEARVIFTDRDDAWVDVADSMKPLDNGREFTWLSERDGWRHLYRLSRDGGEPRLITEGDFDVIDVLKIDERNNRVDFLASIDNPTQRYLFRKTLNGTEALLAETPRDQPGTHHYEISPAGDFAIHTYSTFDTPPQIDLVRLPDHTVIRTFTDNANVRKKLDALAPTPTEFFRIDIGDGVRLDAWAIKPPDFDPSKKYPLIVHVYGEPAGQTVLDRWGGRNALWHRMMAERGYIVVSIDNRGTPAPRGRAWRKCIYRQVGILASADQAAALRALEEKWPYIDPDRVGIWGWSGGGSMTLNAMFRHPDLYKVGVAIAFISDQRLYDTIYQERYMGLPDDNAEGYRNGSPITFADRLEGKLLLIHGTGDDNCHFQSCERLVDRLIAANKDFRLMAYPNRSHGIHEGKNTSRHLYELMTRYFEVNLPVSGD